MTLCINQKCVYFC